MSTNTTPIADLTSEEIAHFIDELVEVTVDSKGGSRVFTTVGHLTGITYSNLDPDAGERAGHADMVIVWFEGQQKLSYKAYQAGTIRKLRS